MEVNLKVPNGPITHCENVWPSIESYEIGKHYSCSKLKSYDCYKERYEGNTILSIQVYRFEFEIDGDWAKIRNKKFSTEAIYCQL